jgi:hypothetical protein
VSDSRLEWGTETKLTSWSAVISTQKSFGANRKYDTHTRAHARTHTHLSAAKPNTTLPNRTPDMNVACVTSTNTDRLHTRSHCNKDTHRVLAQQESALRRQWPAVRLHGSSSKLLKGFTRNVMLRLAQGSTGGWLLSTFLINTWMLQRREI